LGRIGNQSFDAIAGPIANMFDFNPDARNQGSDRILILNPNTGEPQGGQWQ
jgi:phospholipase C